MSRIVRNVAQKLIIISENKHININENNVEVHAQ